VAWGSHVYRCKERHNSQEPMICTKYNQPLANKRKERKKKERNPLQEGMWRTSGPQRVYSPICIFVVYKSILQCCKCYSSFKQTWFRDANSVFYNSTIRYGTVPLQFCIAWYGMVRYRTVRYRYGIGIVVQVQAQVQLHTSKAWMIGCNMSIAKSHGV
jgi:hypothetical protein